MISNLKHSNLLQFENFLQQKNLFHFSTTIKGGTSTGNYSSFNLGNNSGDKAININKNRKILASLLEISEKQFYFPYQTHSDNICIIDSEFLKLSIEMQKNQLNGIDAVITNQKGICIGITTADCIPILIYDPIENALATIHAGWRGTISEIAVKTVQKMIEQMSSKPENMVVGIGPSICQNCFEVGDEVVKVFSKSGFSIKNIGNINQKTGKYHLDLWKANKLILNKIGIPLKNIEISELCTVTNPELFFSARRQTIQSGRMVTGGILL